MKNERLKQFILSLFVALSLLSSSVSAVCSCASHESQASGHSHCEPPTKEHSANRHSHEIADENSRESSFETVSVSESEPGDCCCVQSAPRVFAKTECVKLEKQTAAILPFAPIEFVSISQTVPVKTVDFAAPFYLSDSFHNLTPGRAPPRF